MATCNGSQFIKEQLQSILVQLGPDDELLVSDDNSSDDTVQLIKSFNDPRISIDLNHFGNPVLNFEYLVQKAKGDYVFLSDQDDIWAPNKVEIFLKVFMNNSDVSLVLSDIQIINIEGEKVNKVFYQNGFKTGFLKNILINNFIGCSMAFRKEIRNFILPFPKSIAMHDWWIGTCCLLFSKIYFIDQKLHNYRRHDYNFTQKGKTSLCKKITFRWNLIRGLSLRFIRVKYTR
jgi:glycosyltransferase involved in cell wall biosynthesis